MLKSKSAGTMGFVGAALALLLTAGLALLLTAGLALLPWPAGLAEAQQTGGVKNEITSMSVDAYDGRIVVSWENADTDAKHYVRWKLHEVAVPPFRNPCQVEGCDPADGVEIAAGVREYEITQQVIEGVKGPILNDYMYEVHLRTEGGSWIDVHSAEPTKKSPGGFLERPGIIAGDGQLELSWNAHESAAENGQPVGYRVGWHVGNGEYEWADRPGAGEVTLGNISRGPVLSGRMKYTITGLTNGRMYEVRIHTYLAGRPTFSDQDTLRGWPKKGWTPPTAPPTTPTPTTEESADGRELLMPPCRQDAEATPEPQPPSGTIAFVLCDDDLTIESVATASGITFYPAFSPDRHNYVVHVADSLEEVKITGRLKRMRFPMWSSKQFQYPGFAWAFVTGESVYDPPGRQVLPSGVTVVASNGATRFEDNNRRTRHVKLSPGITTAEIGGRKWFLRGSPSQSEYEAPGFWDNFWYFYQASEKKAHRTYTLQFVWKSEDTPLEAPAEPGGPTRTVDYDTDDDGLIEVSSLAQLDAMRWDVNGDGYSDHGGPLHDGFPNALLGMGCPSSGCVGYELTSDLDFDTNGSGGADPGDDYWNSGHGWLPIGLDTDAFAAVFEGNGHVIRNLYINSNLKKRSEVTGYVKNTHMWAYHRAAHLGLFEAVAAGGVIRNVGLENADVSRNYSCSEEARYLCPQGRASGLVGVNHGKISGSYVTGSVSNIINYSQRVTGSSTPIIAGGLVGFAGSSSVISNSYSMANVSALRDFPDAGMGSEVGGLVGHNDGTIIAAYSTGKVSSNGRAYGIHPAHASGGLVGDNQGSIKASYSIGALSGRLWRNGLVGRNGGSVTASYWDTQTSGRSSSAGGRGRTTAELQGPTGYTGIYAAWNVDLDGDGNKDDSWEFGTSEQYPVLKDLGAAKQRLGAATQVSKRIDYDADDDGLIEIANLDQLQALSRDMNGKGRPSDFAYSIAYPDPAEGMGCPSSGCVGYELSGDLTFEKGYNLLSSIYGYSAIFEGNNHTIGHLIARGGLFGRVNAGGVVRNLRLDSVSAYGTPGGVVAGVNNGLISNVHVVNSHVGAESIVGGLVGVNGSTGVIVDSSADGNPTIIRIWEEREKKLGGLVGVNRGSIRTSYAVGQVYSGGGRLANEYLGGLVGYNEGSVSASYATGKLVVKSELESEILVTRGGLVGVNEGDITASYSTTRASVFAPFGQTMRTLTGGLVASQVSGTVSNSYWDTQASGLSWSAVGTGKTTAQLQGPTSYSGIYANWHLDLDGDGNKDDPWNFGTSQEYPTLKKSGLAGHTRQGQTTYYVDYVAAPVVVAEGQSAVLTVTLSEPAPTGGVEITATPGYSGSATASSDDVGAIVSPATVAEGDTTLEIAIPTIDDKVDENDETFTVVIASNTAGWVKLGADLATAMVSITDDDTAGVTVTADSPFSVAEAGTNTYTVVLDSQPTADVTVTPTSSDDGAVTVAPASYTFTPGKWDTAATFTVSGVADDDSVDESVSISHRASSQDGKYNSIPVSSVSVAVTESQQQQQVNHAPAVASPIADLDGFPVGNTRQVSLSGVFSHAGGDALTIIAGSSDNAVALASVDIDDSTGEATSITVTGNATGTATIAVVAQDPDGDRATDEFSVTVTGLQEPWNLQVVPGDGTITVTWKASPFYYKERLIGAERIKHALRWWQGSNWANPVGEHGFGRNDGIHVESGVTSYVIQNLTNDVAVEVQVRAFFGSNYREGAMNKGASSTSSKWVKAKAVTPKKPNRAPTVASAIDDVTMVNESGTSEVSLSGVFTDADGDDLTVTASSSDEKVATVSVSADYSSLTVTAKKRGTATVTATATDGNGGSVEDSFTVTVKAAPVVASAIADVSELAVDATHKVSLSGVFTDADADSLTVTAGSSKDAVATVSVAADYSGLTLTGKAAGTATITATAQDSDGNSVSDSFDVTVVKPNSAPTVASAISDATIVNESGTKQVSLSGVFTDADSDSLTVTASSSDEKVATVSVTADYSGLTVTAKARGTATITVTAKDGKGGSVEDSFTVTVKAAPAVASAIADIGSLVAGTSQEVALTSVFSDADNDALTLSASSSATAVARVSVATGGSKLTVTGIAEGTATITVTARDSDGNSVSDTFDVTVVKPNSAPTVASAISDATIVNTSGTKRVSLSGVFTDADGDSLTITAKPSAAGVATVSVAADYSTLTVTAKSRGTATITVTASDGKGGSLEDSFTVTVKAPPVVASAIADVSGLAVDATHKVSLSGVFSDADGDSLTVTAGSSKDAVATVSVAADQSGLTLTGKAAGTATVTVTARDSDGNSVRDTFDVTVVKPNSAPTVASAISDTTIVNTSGTKRVSLSGVFTDADGDSLTITAKSSSESVATVSVSADYSILMLTAKARGSATITVTASDGKGGSVEDSFTVTAKAAPVVASAIADVSELAIDATHKVTLAGVFTDADGDSLTVTAGSSKDSVATVAVAADQSGLTLSGVAEGTSTITVTVQDSDGNSVSDAFDVTVVKPNSAPTVASAISDATIVNESGTKQVSLSGVFTDADGDSLTITAKSSSESVATVSVSADYSSLTVTAKARGSATITVTASDGKGGSVEDSFTVTVKAAPVVASAIADISELASGASQEISLSGVFSDADGDALTLSAVSSSSAVATVVAQLDPATASATAITVTGVDEGTATVTVTARDTDGNSASDAFDVTVPVVEEQQAVELPGPVASLAVTASAENGVTVSWSAPETGGAPQGYIVHIKRKGGGYQDTRRPGTDRTQVSFGSLEPGRTYEVWVRAQNETGKGERVSATITLPESEDPEDTLPTALPGPVTGLELTADGNTLTVSWSAPETGGAPDGYIVHVSPDDGGKGKTKTPKAKKTQVTFENLEAGWTYAVWVRAQNEAGKGERVHASVTLPEEGDGQVGQ